MPQSVTPLKLDPATISLKDAIDVCTLMNIVWPKEGVDPAAKGLEYVARQKKGEFREGEQQWFAFRDSDTGVLIAHAASFPRRIKVDGQEMTILAIGAVCTRPEYRRHGLGAAVVKVCFSRVDEGEFGELQFMRGVWHNNLENHPRYWHGLPPMHYITHPLSPMLKLAGRKVADVHCFGSGAQRNERVAVHGCPYPVETAIFRLGSDPISSRVAPKGSASRALSVEVTSIVLETAVQNKETFDLWGTKQSFTWATFYDDKHAVVRIWPARDGGPKSSPNTVFRFDAPSAHDRLPRELHWVSHRQPQPHLVHEFVRASLESRYSEIDIDEAAAYSSPGIVAHKQAMEAGHG